MPGKPTIIPMSITTFYTGPSRSLPERDEVFLLYSKGFEHGPGISRDGMGEPWMQDRFVPQRQIANPVEQRCGTWLIDAHQAKQLEAKLIKQDKNISQSVKEGWLKELDETPNYFDEFKRFYGDDYEIVGMQGCGNLTMNDWFIAYLKSRFTEESKKSLHLHKEEFGGKIYSCLVKYKGTPLPYIKIENVYFDVDIERVRRVSDNSAITDEVEFAVFSQKLVDKGILEDFRGVAPQFADVRHLYKLPNINPNVEFDKTQVIEFKRSRRLFGERRDHDLWFGERQLTRPEYLDVLMHALVGPVLLDRNFDGMGADWDLIEASFPLVGYRRVPDDTYTPRERGEWRKYTERVVEIYLQRNVYAYTMLGLDADGNIIAAAAGGLAGRIGQTIEAMAQNMISAGCQQVLLVDEGNDVFQWIDGEYTVMPRRGRIRAVFVFARNKEKSKHEQRKRNKEPAKSK